MELNYSLKVAEKALEIEPITRKFVKEVLTSRAGIGDKKSVLAITRLCELLVVNCKNRIGERIRKLGRKHLYCLANLYQMSKESPEENEFHRSWFMEGISANDFSIMKYWGLIKPGSTKGCWSITEYGKRFCEGKVSVPVYIRQLGGKKGNYRFDNDVEKKYFCNFIENT